MFIKLKSHPTVETIQWIIRFFSTKDHDKAVALLTSEIDIKELKFYDNQSKSAQHQQENLERRFRFVAMVNLFFDRQKPIKFLA